MKLPTLPSFGVERALGISGGVLRAFGSGPPSLAVIADAELPRATGTGFGDFTGTGVAVGVVDGMDVADLGGGGGFLEGTAAGVLAWAPESRGGGGALLSPVSESAKTMPIKPWSFAKTD